MGNWDSSWCGCRLCWGTSRELFTGDWLPQRGSAAPQGFSSISFPTPHCWSVTVPSLHCSPTVQDVLGNLTGSSWLFYPVTLSAVWYLKLTVFSDRARSLSPNASLFPALLKPFFCHDYTAATCSSSTPAYLPISFAVTVSVTKRAGALN